MKRYKVIIVILTSLLNTNHNKITSSIRKLYFESPGEEAVVVNPLKNSFVQLKNALAYA